MGGHRPLTRSFFRRLKKGSSWFAALALVGCLAGALRASVFDYSAPLDNPEASFLSGLVSYSIFDPAQNQTMRGSVASGPPGGLSTNNGVVAWSSGSLVFSRVYDPSRTNWMGTEVASGPTLDLRNGKGIVAWSTGAAVHFMVYEPTVGEWVRGQQVAGATYNLRNEDGIVSWSSANVVFTFAYDPARKAWVGDSVASGNTFDLSNRDGVVAWSSGGLIYYTIYDPVLGRWVRQSTASGTTATLRNEGGAVAWGSGNAVFCRVYDPRQQTWIPLQEPLSSPPSNLAITNAIITWSVVGGTRTRAYNPLSSAWTNAPAPPLAHFAVSTNAGGPPLLVRFIDMSVGARAWGWSFGDGGASFQRAPTYTYAGVGRYSPSLLITGAAGNSSFATNILTDVEGPVGTIVINDGATLTTNREVALTLQATDNSGVVAGMRLRNAGTEWGAWEPYATARDWTLPDGVGERKVEAQFRDGSLTESAVASDTIQLDTTPLPEVAFAVAETNVLESVGVMEIAVRLSQAFTRDVRVRCATTGGTAQPGVHYQPIDEELRYTPGFRTQTVDLTILANQVTEPNRTIELTLTVVSNAVAGEPMIVTVLDDDPASVRFEQATSTVNEGDGSAVIPVVLEAPAGFAVSVGYRSTGGTAEPGVDYQPVQGRVEFAPEQTRAEFAVPLIDNDLDQGDRTVALELFDPTEAVLSAPSQAVLTIQDNDPPTVNLTQAEYRFQGRAGSAEIGVHLSKPGTQTILVDCATPTGGTAVPGVDYVVVNNTLVFSPPQTARPFAVTILDNPQRTTPRTIRLQLSNPVNATLGTQAIGLLRIEDPTPIHLSNARVEANGTFRFDIVSEAGATLQVEGSLDLKEWETLETLSNPSGTITYTDAEAAQLEQRYYRVTRAP